MKTLASSLDSTKVLILNRTGSRNRANLVGKGYELYISSSAGLSVAVFGTFHATFHIKQVIVTRHGKTSSKSAGTNLRKHRKNRFFFF